jgi:hypothetical protein
LRFETLGKDHEGHKNSFFLVTPINRTPMCFLLMRTTLVGKGRLFRFVIMVMDIRSERKISLKVREQQEAEFERIEATKKRYGYIFFMLRLM